MDKKKQLKTYQKQREAVDRYREKVGNNYKTFSVCLPKDEHEQHRATMAEHGAKPVDVWRKGIEALKAQPITPTESATPDESPDGNTDGANG